MSFSEEVKRELCSASIPDGCREAFVYGLTYGFHGQPPCCTSMNGELIDHIAELFPESAARVVTSGTGSHKSFTLTLTDPSVTERYGYASPSVNRHIVSGNDIVTGIFLRGVFMSCGSVSLCPLVHSLSD